MEDYIYIYSAYIYLYICLAASILMIVGGALGGGMQHRVSDFSVETVWSDARPSSSIAVCCYYDEGDLQILDVKASKLQQALETDIHF